MSPLPLAQVKSCWENVTQHSQLAERQAAAEKFNRENRWRKRGISVIPTKFGISFTTKASSAVDGTCDIRIKSYLVCVTLSLKQSTCVQSGLWAVLSAGADTRQMPVSVQLQYKRLP